MSSQDPVIIPCPGTTSSSPPKTIPAPSESAFTSTFGTLLPPATYLKTPNGEIAYYSFPPITPSPFSRHVLLLHGVQTSAIGLLPLITHLHKNNPETHLVAPDLYGHGLSSTPLTPHTPSLFQSLLTTLLTHLAWPSVHLIGYSFGATIITTYLSSAPRPATPAINSYTLIAPAGLLRLSTLPHPLREAYQDHNDATTRTETLSFLEDGPLVVPSDWEARFAQGEIVAEAVRHWQNENHPGHLASVVAMFRDGGALDQRESFVKTVESKVPGLVVLGGEDDVCGEGELREIGFGKVVVMEGEGHGVVRSRAEDVAGEIGRFWEGLRNET